MIDKVDTKFGRNESIADFMQNVICIVIVNINIDIDNIETSRWEC